MTSRPDRTLLHPSHQAHQDLLHPGHQPPGRILATQQTVPRRQVLQAVLVVVVIQNMNEWDRFP